MDKCNDSERNEYIRTKGSEFKNQIIVTIYLVENVPERSGGSRLNYIFVHGSGFQRKPKQPFTANIK